MFNSVHKSTKSPPDAPGDRKSEIIEQYQKSREISAIKWNGSRANGQSYCLYKLTGGGIGRRRVLTFDHAIKHR